MKRTKFKGVRYLSTLNQLNALKTLGQTTINGKVLLYDPDYLYIVDEKEYYTKNEVDSAIDNALSNVYKFKGSVATYSELPDPQLVDLQPGYVYNVIDTNGNYAWKEDNTWDPLGATVDLSGYQELIDSEHKLSADLISEGSVNALYTSDEKIKLAGIESGAQVNSVTSVNTQTGAVVLDADDLDDSETEHKFVSATEKSTWDSKQDALTFDSAPTEDSTNPVTSHGVYTALADEVSRATGAENTLTTNLASEITRATEAESTLTTNLNSEISTRASAVTNLQNQIDAMESRTDVVDVVATKADLNSYTTTGLSANDIIKVLADETRSGATSYYRLDNGNWDFVGSVGPYYTKGETDNLLSNKQDNLTFDTTPTNDSSNPITSGAVYTALSNVQSVLTFDSTPTEDSTNPVTSHGVYTALADEVSRATSAESTLTTNLNSEITTRTAAITNLNANLQNLNIGLQNQISKSNNLQDQIDAIESRTDVVDIVATKADLDNYNTTYLSANDVIKVLADETRNNSISYYRLTNDSWTFIGSIGPYYTKGETDTLLSENSVVPDFGKRILSEDTLVFEEEDGVWQATAENWSEFMLNTFGDGGEQSSAWIDWWHNAIETENFTLPQDYRFTIVYKNGTSETISFSRGQDSGFYNKNDYNASITWDYDYKDVSFEPTSENAVDIMFGFSSGLTLRGGMHIEADAETGDAIIVFSNYLYADLSENEGLSPTNIDKFIVWTPSCNEHWEFNGPKKYIVDNLTSAAGQEALGKIKDGDTLIITTDKMIWTCISTDPGQKVLEADTLNPSNNTQYLTAVIGCFYNDSTQQWNTQTIEGTFNQVEANPTLAGEESALNSVKIGSTNYTIPSGTTVVANPQGNSNTDLAKIQIGNNIFNIPEGAEIEANPAGEPTAALTKIAINGVIYSIEGGSGALDELMQESF